MPIKPAPPITSINGLSLSYNIHYSDYKFHDLSLKTGLAKGKFKVVKIVISVTQLFVIIRCLEITVLQIRQLFTFKKDYL